MKVQHFPIEMAPADIEALAWQNHLFSIFSHENEAN